MIKLGDPYFAPVRHEDGGASVEYQGIVVGLIIRNDEGHEFTIRDGVELSKVPKPLTWDELQTIPLYSKVWFQNKPAVIDRIFPGQGVLWIALVNDDGTMTPPFEVKYFEVTKSV